MTPVFDALNEFGRWLVSHLGPVSIELALLTAIVIAALAALRPQSPAVRHLFWCLVLLKPLTTILIASPVSLGGILELRPAVPVTPAVAVDVADSGRSGAVDASPLTRQRGIGRQLVSSVDASLKHGPMLDCYGIGALLYLLLAAVLGLRLLVGQAYVSFLCRTADVPRDGALAEILARTARRWAWITGRRSWSRT